MFFSGGTFGSASEARDANKRPSGRRHQPRDMAEVQAALDATNMMSKAPTDGTRSLTAQKNMASAPSFLDRMFEHNSTIVESTNQARRRGSIPADHLNIFSWQDNTSASREPGQSRMMASNGSRASLPAVATGALLTAEDRRAMESKKFESKRDGLFLCFTDDSKAKRKANTKGDDAQTGAQPGKPVKSSAPGGDMMGSLMREQPHKARGRRAQGAAPNSNWRGVPEESGVAGFPGMGQRSAPRAVHPASRRPVESNVFPQAIPEKVQQQGFGGDGSSCGAPVPVPVSESKSVPPYFIDEQDYEDKRYTNTYDEEAYDNQSQMQTIEMNGDDSYGYDDHTHASAPMRDASHRFQEGRSPEWLREPGASGPQVRFVENSPSVQARRYNFDSEGELVCDSSVRS